MFESVEIGAEVSRDEFQRREPDLRLDLLNLQFDLRGSRSSVIIVLDGDDLPGRDDAADRLNAWMDARYIDTRFFGMPEERSANPIWMARYWEHQPPAGRIGAWIGAWTSEAIVARTLGSDDEARFASRLQTIRAFERTLIDSGVLLLKFWLHVPRSEIKRRVKEGKKRPERRSPVYDSTRALDEHYEEMLPVAIRAMRETEAPQCPWRLIESTDSRHRDLAVTTQIRDALVAQAASPAVDVAPSLADAPARMQLESVTMTPATEYETYRKRLEELQMHLRALVDRARAEGIASVLVFEGWDAAGKGGAIRRITGALSARDYTLTPIAAPNEEERARHYLWRFWRRLPTAGRMAIFDRSWCGRVLVERVEGFATDAQWMRAYREINEFESQITDAGVVLCKFFLHIDRAEQERRFEARSHTAYKKYKFTEEDKRNRARWDDYVRAADEMLARTDAATAPWTIVASNDKRTARLQVLEAVCAALEKRLKK
jgi:polyphosphate:AMP phosphotransferase